MTTLRTPPRECDGKCNTCPFKDEWYHGEDWGEYCVIEVGEYTWGDWRASKEDE